VNDNRWMPIDTFPVDAFAVDGHPAEAVMIAAKSFKDGVWGMFLAVWDVDSENFLVLQPDAKDCVWCDTFYWEVTHWREAPMWPDYGGAP
jgi:hypothetical protein